MAIQASRTQNREVYNNSSHASNNVHKIGFTKGQSASKYNQNRSSHQKSSKIIDRSINLQELGLSGLCLHCGEKNHQTDNCRIKEKLHCNLCRKKGTQIKYVFLHYFKKIDKLSKTSTSVQIPLLMKNFK